MANIKVAVKLDIGLLRRDDRSVRGGRFHGRSSAVQAALAEMLTRRKRSRFAKELAKVDSREERALAEEALSGEAARAEF